MARKNGKIGDSHSRFDARMPLTPAARVELSKPVATAAAPLVVRFGALGDMVLLTPLLRCLHRRYGQTCVVLGSGPWLDALYAGNPEVGGVLAVHSRKRPYWLDRSQQRLVKTLRALPPGPIYVCDDYALDKIRWLLDRAGIAPERCVYANPLCLLGSDEHWIDRWLRFGAKTPRAFEQSRSRSSVPESPEDCRVPRLCVDARDRADLNIWLHRHDLIGRRVVLFQPGNKRTLKRGRAGQFRDGKAWPPGHWSALLQAVLARDPELRVVLCGVPAERGILRSIARAANSARVIEAANDLPLRRLMALCEVASAMISIDSGPAHVGAAMGCPLIVLYGAARPAQWLPRSPTGSAIVALGGPPQRSRVAEIGLQEVVVAWNALPLREVPGLKTSVAAG